MGTYIMRIERCECGAEPTHYFKAPIWANPAARAETFCGLCAEEAAAQRKAYRDGGENPAQHIARVPAGYKPGRAVLIVARHTD